METKGTLCRALRKSRRRPEVDVGEEERWTMKRNEGRVTGRRDEDVR